MKTTMLLLLLCSSFLTVCYGGYSESKLSAERSSLAEEEEEKDIDCRGNLPPQTPIRTPIPKDVPALYAVLKNNNISVKFNFYVGTINVSIEDENGTVFYQHTVDSSTGEIIISTIGLPMGNYTIAFSNDQGSMWGDFEV